MIALNRSIDKIHAIGSSGMNSLLLVTEMFLMHHGWSTAVELWWPVLSFVEREMEGLVGNSMFINNN